MYRLAVTIAVMVVALCAPLLGTSATELNNGSKLILKEGTDSLFCTYQYYDLVQYSYSEGGETWYSALVDTIEHDHPTIATDSTGRRWIVARCPVIFPGFPVAQQAYYWNGSRWYGPQSVYTINPIYGDLRPASLDGAAFTSTSWAYAAFRETLFAQNGSQRIVLTKFNGTSVAACTIMTRVSLGDPAIAVEPYGADSNRIHITWEANDSIRYAVCLDSRTSSSIGDVALLDIPLDCGTVQHPSIDADRGRVVVAWAKGSGEPDAPEIYTRWRATSGGTWEDAVNLSNSYYNPSDWPTVTLGALVVVAWEEAISANDHDILVCVDYNDENLLNIANNSTLSSFPHITLQPDDLDLYLHTFWSESDYTVDHDVTQLVDGGKGQQGAASVPIAGKPSLAACEPNPFQSRTRIGYVLPAAGNVSLGVYDATGRSVRTLVSGQQKAGSYSVSWDALDAEGKQVPYGVYFYRLDTPGFRVVQKAVLTK
jgi:hypothetical protein